MRRYRARKHMAGLRAVTEWRPVSPGTWSDHRILDARSLAVHCLIARKLARDPALLNIARRNIARWRASYGDPTPPCFEEWGEVLTEPLSVILDLITAFDERAIRLRQSSPFAGVLCSEERDRIHAAFAP